MTWIDFTTYFETLPSDRIDLALRVESDRMVERRLRSRRDRARAHGDHLRAAGQREQPGLPAGRGAAGRRVPGPLLPSLGHRLAVRPGDHDARPALRALPHVLRAQQRHRRGRRRLRERTRCWRASRSCSAPSRPGPRCPPFTTDRAAAARRAPGDGRGSRARPRISRSAIRAPDATHPDYYPLVVLDTILGGAKGMSLWGGGTSNRSSRLYKALVETELASDADCAISSTDRPVPVQLLRHRAPGPDAGRGRGRDAGRDPAGDRRAGQRGGVAARRSSRRSAQFAYSSESVTDQGYWLGFTETRGRHRAGSRTSSTGSRR